jgi:16S rRNA (adenine1518-N6/adenine1519-N6)-dimethyltransferase
VPVISSIVGESLPRQLLIKQARSFHTKKRLGQHFLVEPEVLQKIASCLNIEPKEEVLEIGPGIGFLSKYLLEAGAQLTAVELDNDCVSYLRKMNLPNFQITHGDFLQFDLASLNVKHLKIVGNVPYQITTPILCHLFGEIGEPKPWSSLIKDVVLTVQYEVAERFVAEPGGKDYSQISLLTRYFTKPEIIEVVPPTNFFPPPAVTSAIVRLTPLEKPAVTCQNPQLLRQIIRTGFKQRRKMLKNNLHSILNSESALMRLFQSLKFDPQLRAERLSLEQFARLADALDSLLKSTETQSH